MQFEGGYQYPSTFICISFSILGILFVSLIWYWKHISIIRCIALFSNLEGTILLASAFTPKGLKPPPPIFYQKLRWFFIEQSGVPVSFNQPFFYGGILLLLVGSITGVFAI